MSLDSNCELKGLMDQTVPSLNYTVEIDSLTAGPRWKDTSVSLIPGL